MTAAPQFLTAHFAPTLTGGGRCELNFGGQPAWAWAVHLPNNCGAGDCQYRSGVRSALPVMIIVACDFSAAVVFERGCSLGGLEQIKQVSPMPDLTFTEWCRFGGFVDALTSLFVQRASMHACTLATVSQRDAFIKYHAPLSASKEVSMGDKQRTQREMRNARCDA